MGRKILYADFFYFKSKGNLIFFSPMLSLNSCLCISGRGNIFPSVFHHRGTLNSNLWNLKFCQVQSFVKAQNSKLQYDFLCGACRKNRVSSFLEMEGVIQTLKICYFYSFWDDAGLFSTTFGSLEKRLLPSRAATSPVMAWHCHKGHAGPIMFPTFSLFIPLGFELVSICMFQTCTVFNLCSTTLPSWNS